MVCIEVRVGGIDDRLVERTSCTAVRITGTVRTRSHEEKSAECESKGSSRLYTTIGTISARELGATCSLVAFVQAALLA